MRNKILITCALPYANGPLHFGHIAGAYLPGDCFARFARLKGDDVLFICGSDEYGIAITLSAQKAGRTPKEQVDLYHEVIKQFFTQLNLSFDHYSRTTWPGHVSTVHQYFLELLENKYIEPMVTEQLYSEQEGRFLADRYVVGTCPKCGFENARGDECQRCGSSYEATDLINPRSQISGTPCIRRKTEHWFLKLELFKEKLLKWLQTKNWKPNVLNFAKAYIEDLRPRAITRDSEWGVPVPLKEAQGKVLYVWFDAPIGYISATKEWAHVVAKDEKAWEKWWLDPDVTLVQFMGKDNIPFHAAVFPAMTMGQGVPYKLVDDLCANEFYNLEGRQFSKSDGWTVDLERFFTRYESDQIRYAIASNAPETSDAEFTWKDFFQRCNGDLVGKWGNLANRTLTFLQKQSGGQIPQASVKETIDEAFTSQIRLLTEEAFDAYSQYKLRKASQVVMELAQAGNVYFDAKKPWLISKDPTLLPSMQTTVALCLECLKMLALISLPIIPRASCDLWQLLGFKKQLQSMTWEEVLKEPMSGDVLPQPRVLFQKIDPLWIAEEEELLKQKVNK